MKNLSSVIQQARDVPIRLVNSEMDDGTVLDLISHFQFRNHVGPIVVIEIKIEDRVFLILSVTVRGLVLDSFTKQPVEVILSDKIHLYGGDRTRHFGEMLKRSIFNFFRHEVDEGLMLDNDFFTDPHPELEKGKESVAAR